MADGAAGAAVASALAEIIGLALGLALVWHFADGGILTAVAFRCDKLVRTLPINAHSRTPLASTAFFNDAVIRAGPSAHGPSRD